MPYPYDALDADNYEIRILALNLDSPDGDLSCTLEKHSLINPPRYAALSYCWGNESITKPLAVDGSSVDITINLFEALQRLRQLKVLRVWADAICINQRDSREKSDQIRNMTRVYLRAETTYIYLGGEHVEGAVTAVQALSRLSATYHGEDHRRLETVLTRAMIVTPAMSVGEKVEQGKELHLFTKIFGSFCGHEYWKRRWVIQEVTTASRVAVLCGTTSLAFQDVVNAMQSKRDSRGWHGWNGIDTSDVERVLTFRRRYQANIPLSLVQSIFETQGSKSKDPRDQLFALLGICSDGAELIPLPNYRQPPEELVRNLTIALLDRAGSLALVFQPQWRNDPARSSLVPWWSPDWLSPTLPAFAFQAQRSARSRFVAQPLQGDHHTLRVQGICLGTIVSTTTNLTESCEDATERGTLPLYANLSSRHDLYYGAKGGLEMHAALIRCLFNHSEHSYSQLARGVEDWDRAEECLDDLYRQIRLVSELRAQEHKEWPGFRAEHPNLTSLTDWMACNQDFTLHGHTLQHWLTRDLETHKQDLMAHLLGTFYCALFLIPFWLTGIIVIAVRPKLWPIGVAILSLGAFFLMFTCSPIYGANIAQLIVLAVSPRHVSQTKDCHRPSSGRLALLDCGMLAMTCREARAGDKICIIVGHSIPVVLRCDLRRSREYHAFIGESYVEMSSEDEYLRLAIPESSQRQSYDGERWQTVNAQRHEASDLGQDVDRDRYTQNFCLIGA